MASEPVSIIIPALNEQSVIRDLLQSLQRFRYQGHELILVDGGSRDGTLDLAWPLVDSAIRSAPGRAVQMNAGAARSRHAVLWFLHADSQVPADAVAALQIALANEPGCWGRFDVRLSGQQPALRMVEFMMNWRSRLTGIATGDQAIFVRRRAFDQVGGFPEIPLMEDLAISRRLKQLSRPCCLRIRILTSSRRWEQGGVWRTIFQMWRLRLAYSLGADPADLARRYTSKACTPSRPGS